VCRQNEAAGGRRKRRMPLFFQLLIINRLFSRLSVLRKVNNNQIK
jgi:hypothetical protein